MKTTVALCLVYSVSLYAQQAQDPLTDQRIATLVTSGVNIQEVLRIIGSAPQINFDLTPSGTDAMMKAGVSEEVIKAMAAREAGIQAPVSSPALAAGRLRPDNPAAVPANPVRASNAPTDTRVAAPISQPRAPVANVYNVGQQSEGHKLTYDGGSIPDLKTGADVKLYLGQNQIRVLKGGSVLVALPATAITEVSYGQDVHRRVGAAIGLATISFGVGALMALTKSKKHFIGITWDDAGKKGGAAFQADKNDYRGVLAGLEGLTGRQAVNSSTMTVHN